jgi:hypothetical protein
LASQKRQRLLRDRSGLPKPVDRKQVRCKVVERARETVALTEASGADNGFSSKLDRSLNIATRKLQHSQIAHGHVFPSRVLKLLRQLCD